MNVLDFAKDLLSKLSPALQASAVFDLHGTEHLDWTYVPRKRRGLRLDAMNDEQQQASAGMLHEGLSNTGLKKVVGIRDLEKVLHEIQGGNPIRNPCHYYFTIFGIPADGSLWGWRYEGHHCSLNWVLQGARVIASSPQFFGANPAEVQYGPMVGTRVLAAEEDLALCLLQSLDETQLTETIIDEQAPPDICSGTQHTVASPEQQGITYDSMGQEQRTLLLNLIEEYMGAYPQEVARERLARIHEAGISHIRFAWRGRLEKTQNQYYQITGPTFIIEFNNTINHIHSVWRDFNNDFGRNEI